MEYRNTYYTFTPMKAKKIKRTPHSYKCIDKDYKDAMKRAKKEKGTLTNLIECVIKGYANGLDVRLYKEGIGKASILDLFSSTHGEEVPNFITIFNQK